LCKQTSEEIDLLKHPSGLGVDGAVVVDQRLGLLLQRFKPVGALLGWKEREPRRTDRHGTTTTTTRTGTR